MIRQIFRASGPVLLLIVTNTSCPSQTLSGCRPSPPMKPNVKPGVDGLSLTRDGKTLVAAGYDGKIRFIDVTTGNVERTLSGHTNAIYLSIFSPNYFRKQIEKLER